MTGLTMSTRQRRATGECLDEAFAVAAGSDFKAASYRLWLARPSVSRNQLIDLAGISMAKYEGRLARAQAAWNRSGAGL